jgi:hypothetical protein
VPGFSEVVHAALKDLRARDEGQRSDITSIKESSGAPLTLQRLGCRGVQSTECSMSSYPIHRSLPPTRRFIPTTRLVSRARSPYLYVGPQTSYKLSMTLTLIAGLWSGSSFLPHSGRLVCARRLRTSSSDTSCPFVCVETTTTRCCAPPKRPKNPSGFTRCSDA